MSQEASCLSLAVTPTDEMVETAVGVSAYF